MFVANALPGSLLKIFDWNPLFHAIDQARGFIFLNYNPHFSSWEYALWVALGLIVLGLTRRILHAPARLDVVARRAVSGALSGALAALLLAAPPPAAAAQDLPATVRVVGRGRARRRSTSGPRPGLDRDPRDPAPTATGIEVLAYSPDGHWAEVPLPEGPGWVSRRFLAAEPAGAGPAPPARLPGDRAVLALRLDGAGATLDLPRPARCRCAPRARPRGATGWVAAYRSRRAERGPAPSS